MIDEATLAQWKDWARRDEWHVLFVGSDIRQMVGEIERLRQEATRPQVCCTNRDGVTS